MKEPIRKKCEACSDKFIASRQSQRYCYRCFQRIYHPSILEPKACAECSKEFTPSKAQQRFCSSGCQIKNYNRRTDAAGKLRMTRMRRKLEIQKGA